MLSPGGDAEAAQLPAKKLRYDTYGDYSEQRPEFETFGRYDPFLTTDRGDGSYGVYCRYDRGEADMLRRIGAGQALPDAAWRSGVWCGQYNRRAAGVWEVDLTMPKRAGIGYALMLWPQDDSIWPTGEINLAEGITGSGEVMNNMHWGRSAAAAHHRPMDYKMDTSGRHRYRVAIETGRIRYSIDGKLIRTLESSMVPADVPVHLVLQCGPKISELGSDYPSNFEFTEQFVLRPRKMPG